MLHLNANGTNPAHSVLTDLILSFIPLTLIWKVNIPPRKKILVMCLMSLGLVASAFGITRAAFLGVSNDDLSWTFCIVAIWSNLELFLGIVAANLALSRAVYLYVRGRHETSKDHSHPSSSAYVNSGGRRERVDYRSTLINSSRRRQPSEAMSSNSDIPLEPGKQRSAGARSGEDDAPGIKVSFFGAGAHRGAYKRRISH